ncbi:aspartyl protease family protein [Winogradskyella flava]|uniref:Aspartyl protease family protein n=1 Tax=Winogradskyella flava TaxID=1884876 RepID=A0A842IWA6_9FLAO|nr:aspartyl protease family protein [Winogradskyella flava]MBC2845088.1 aspartyl protease family protein [Winogradskyella flava]
MKKFLSITCILIILLCHSCNSFGQDQPLAQIPFALNDDGHIIISLKINNHTVSNFVLDTGASVTVIDKTIVNELSLPLQDIAAKITGTSGVNDDVKKTQKQQVALSDVVVLNDIEMYVSDLSHLGNIKGLIGFDLFKEFVSETNFDTKTISFYKPKGKPDTKGYKSISFNESFCTPEIKLSVTLSDNTSLSGKVFFDTGDMSTPFTFSSPFVKKHKLQSKFDTLVTTESRGINSKSSNKVGAASSINIKGFELSEMPVTLSNSTQGMLSIEPYMGNLGLEYISKFNFILDYNKKKIFLKPNATYHDVFNFPIGGVRLEKKGKEIFIRSVAKPSAAYDKGIRAGQQLISIDGVAGESLTYYKDILKKENKEVTLIIKLEDGTLKTIVVLLSKLI